MLVIDAKNEALLVSMSCNFFRSHEKRITPKSLSLCRGDGWIHLFQVAFPLLSQARGADITQTYISIPRHHSFTLDYPPTHSSPLAHPQKSCGPSSAGQAVVKVNLSGSATRVTGGRMRLALHPILSQRWRSCHANPARKQRHD